MASKVPSTHRAFKPGNEVGWNRTRGKRYLLDDSAKHHDPAVDFPVRWDRYPYEESMNAREEKTSQGASPICFRGQRALFLTKESRAGLLQNGSRHGLARFVDEE